MSVKNAIWKRLRQKSLISFWYQSWNKKASILQWISYRYLLLCSLTTTCSGFQLVEYIIETKNNVIFVGALLLKDEIAIFDQVYMQHTDLSQKEHNSILNTLLKESGRLKIVCIIVSPDSSSTEKVAIVLLNPHSELPTGNDMTKLTSRISKKMHKHFWWISQNIQRIWTIPGHSRK